MASDINSLVLVGRITRDAELRYTANGSALSNFSIAVNRRVKKGEQWIDEASFVELTLWNKQAEGLNKYLTKGTQIAVRGSLEQQRWESDGKKHSKLFVRVDSIQLIGGRGSATDHNDKPSSNSNHGNPSLSSGDFDPVDYDGEDSIPF